MPERSRGLVTVRSRRLTIHDRDGLAEPASFDPTSLHVTVEADRA